MDHMGHKSLKSCPVCGVLEAKKSPVHKHYGGSCCLSCKAFFRRAVASKKSTEHFRPCPTFGRCAFTNDAKIKCVQCRYSKCLAVGMKEELIPNEEERKKFTFPKKKKTFGCNESQLDSILRSYNEATIELMELKESKAMSAVIISAFMSPMVAEESVRIMSIASDFQRALFKIFSYKLDQFQSLDRTTQLTLLSKNSGLFTQFILAHFIFADNGFDQLTWLLGGSAPQISKCIYKA